MDRIVGIHLFRVLRPKNSKIELSAALRSIAQMPLVERELEIEPEVVIRLERSDTSGGNVSGEMVRIQTTNLPPEAESGKPVRPLNARGVGHSIVFSYDPRQGVIALQTARNAVTSTRMALYVDKITGGGPYSFLPILSADAWDRLQRGKVRAIEVKASNPESLQAADARATNMRDGLLRLRRALATTTVRVETAMERGEPDINKLDVLALFRWLRREKEENRGGISRLAAKVVPEDGTGAEILNLLEAQMGSKATLDLPANDPDGSYAMRLAYVKRILRDHRRDLESQNE